MSLRASGSQLTSSNSVNPDAAEAILLYLIFFSRSDRRRRLGISANEMCPSNATGKHFNTQFRRWRKNARCNTCDCREKYI